MIKNNYCSSKKNNSSTPITVTITLTYKFIFCNRKRTFGSNKKITIFTATTRKIMQRCSITKEWLEFNFKLKLTFASNNYYCLVSENLVYYISMHTASIPILLFDQKPTSNAEHSNNIKKRTKLEQEFEGLKLLYENHQTYST